MAEQSVYESSVAFDAARVGAAAIYFSDGRYGGQMDEFLHQGCGWPRYDRMADNCTISISRANESGNTFQTYGSGL